MSALQRHGIDPERIRAMTAHWIQPQPVRTHATRIVKEGTPQKRTPHAASRIRAAMNRLLRFTAQEVAQACELNVKTVRCVINAGMREGRVLKLPGTSYPCRYTMLKGNRP